MSGCVTIAFQEFLAVIEQSCQNHIVLSDERAASTANAVYRNSRIKPLVKTLYQNLPDKVKNHIYSPIFKMRNNDLMSEQSMHGGDRNCLRLVAYR